MTKFGMCFGKDFIGVTPLSHIGRKLPTYLRLLELAQAEGWEVYVLTYKTYIGESKFNGAWLFKDGKFERVEKEIKIDLIFDWVGNLKFPPKDNKDSKVGNIREFKELTWNKWDSYQLLDAYMPKTLWVGNIKNVDKYLNEITTENIVLKPYDGLRGKGIYIGPKSGLSNFTPNKHNANFILQEFVDTSGGIPNITSGKHDLRVVVVNGEAVWCHVRVPAVGTFLANAAQGGNLTEVDYSLVPKSVKRIVEDIAARFKKDYDNPIYSIDFGFGIDGIPKIFEINDQIGFPRWEALGRDAFLHAVIAKFKLMTK